MSDSPFNLDSTILQAPLQSVITPRVARTLDDETAQSILPTLLSSPAVANPTFAGLPTARPYQPGMAARNFLAATATPIDRNYQRNLTTLENKYAELAPFFKTLPPHVQQALIDLDTRRVSQGSSPLTREQTIKAAATAVSDTPATPVPERASGLFGFFKNIQADASDMLRSIPRIPYGIFNEFSELTQMGDRLQEAQDAGMNPLAAVLRAPGVRMIPLTYTLGNIANGDFGEIAQHPLMTALDILPAANAAARGTAVSRGVQMARETQVAELGRAIGRELPAPSPRPISAFLTNRLTETGAVERNLLGATLDKFRTETPIGQRFESAFGARARQVEKERGFLKQRMKMFMMGMGDAKTPLESLVRDVAPMFKRYEEKYPFLTTDPNISPKLAKQYKADRAKFYDLLTTEPHLLDPAFVAEWDDLMYRDAAYQESVGGLGRFDNETYPTAIADKLQKVTDRADTSRRISEFRNEYLNPSGTLTRDQLRAMADEVRAVAPRYRSATARAYESVLDAYGIDLKPKLPLGKRRELFTSKGDWDAWYREVTDILDDPGLVLRPRTSLDEIVRTLRTQRADYQAGKLEQALLDGDTAAVTRVLDNLYSRKPPTFDPQVYTNLRDDIRSMSRRRKFDAQVGSRYNRVLNRHMAAVEKLRDQYAPARFGPLLSREVYGYVDPKTGTLTPGRIARDLESSIGRTLTADEAGQLARDVYDKQWAGAGLLGLDPQFVSDYASRVQKEVTATWRDLRAAGHNPRFVHKVTPHRAQETLTGEIGPVPTDETHLNERAIDLTPDAMRDVQVSLTHQMAESLSKQYSEQFIQNVIAIVGVPESALQAHFLDEARRTASLDPTMTSRGWLQKLTRDAYRRFNPEEAGFSWGGARFTDYYNENAYYIPTAIYDNLKRYAKRPSLFSSAIDPLTKTFRYNVIGLSPSVILNNFFSNSVAMTAERGLRPWRHFAKAWEWAKNPAAAGIPDELRAMMLAEIPHMEHLGMDAYLQSRTGQKFMSAVNARHAFDESAAYTAVQAGKKALDGVVEKSMKLQRLGDNVYRAMIYLDEIERSALKGTAASTAHANAMGLVQRTLVDYSSFTPIERNAIRTIIPFYSYMGHAARFIMRYPLNHPTRAFIVSRIADFERERLGSLPGSFLSFLPIGSMDAMGKLNMFNLRPFDPFGDQADLLSISGWVAAANPAIQVALRQIGVTRGEAEIYPTLRYDPETGRMRAVRPNPLTDLLMTAVPRAGLLASLSGLNPDYNELRARDQNAANRSLLAQAGIPRVWRQFDIPEEQMRAELSRQQVEDDVLNNALRSGNWTEALRYPNLRAYYAQVQDLSTDEIAALTPAAPNALGSTIRDEILKL